MTSNLRRLFGKVPRNSCRHGSRFKILYCPYARSFTAYCLLAKETCTKDTDKIKKANDTDCDREEVIEAKNLAKTQKD